MRRPAKRHIALGLCYAVGLLVVADNVYWRRLGGPFNHQRPKGA